MPLTRCLLLTETGHLRGIAASQSDHLIRSAVRFETMFGLRQPAAAFRPTACCWTNVIKRSRLNEFEFTIYPFDSRLLTQKSITRQQAAEAKAAAGCRSPGISIRHLRGQFHRT